MPLEERAREACLVWCNEIRAKQKKEPLIDLPKGKIADPESCPCGKATGLYVSAFAYYSPMQLGHMDFHGNLPQLVRDFVYLFDSRQYPDLIEE